MSDYFSVEHPIRLAHRGSRVLWPENTMRAFSGAVDDLGYAYLEIDVRLTADRVPVVVHDATLDRTTDGLLENIIGRSEHSGKGAVLD